MEQTLAPGAGLTPRQKQFLDLAVSEPYFRETFYLSGGTALSSWYLHHRESYDLDLFSLAPFDYGTIRQWFRQNQTPIGYKYSTFDEDFGSLAVNLRYPNDTFLKIDFNHYAKTKLSPEIMWHGLKIDSLYDITVNKVDTIATRPRTRDYVDLYFILTANSWPIQNLVNDAAIKFSEKIDQVNLAKNFLKVSEYTDFPKMLVPFDRKDMERFYLDLARSLKSEILK